MFKCCDKQATKIIIVYVAKLILQHFELEIFVLWSIHLPILIKYAAQLQMLGI